MSVALMAKPLIDRISRRPRERFRRRIYTYADYAAWSPDFRAEIIDGEVITMTAPTTAHQRLLTRLLVKLVALTEGVAEVFPAPTAVRLFPQADAGDTTVFEPDIVVVRDRAQIDKNGIVGAPAMVVEVLSESTRHYDLKVKRDKYADAGVPVYWLVDADRREILVNVLTDNGYRQTAYARNETAPLLIVDGEISLSALFVGL